MSRKSFFFLILSLFPSILYANEQAENPPKKWLTARSENIHNKLSPYRIDSGAKVTVEIKDSPKPIKGKITIINDSICVVNKIEFKPADIRRISHFPNSTSDNLLFWGIGLGSILVGTVSVLGIIETVQTTIGAQHRIAAGVLFIALGGLLAVFSLWVLAFTSIGYMISRKQTFTNDSWTFEIES